MKNLPSMNILCAVLCLLLFSACTADPVREVSTLIFRDHTGQRIELFTDQYPEHFTDNEAVQRFLQAATYNIGSIRSAAHVSDIDSGTNLFYRMDSFSDAYHVPDGKVIRYTFNAVSAPLLWFTINGEGIVSSVGAIPSFSADASSISVEIPVIDAIQSIGFISLKKLDSESSFTPLMEVVDPGTEFILSGARYIQPASLRVLANGTGIEIQGLDMLLSRVPDNQLSFLTLDYSHQLSVLPPGQLPVQEEIPLNLRFTDDTEKAFRFRLRPGRNSIHLHEGFTGGEISSLSLGTIPDDFILHGGSADHVSKSADIPEPLPADLGSLNLYSPDYWRNSNYELFSWSLYPNVLFFDFSTYAVQGRFFSRLAFYVEKAGYQGQLLSNEELSDLHAYNAHNYNGEGLSSFFNSADAHGFTLNPEEELLRQIVLDAGIITGERGSYEAGRGGILSISQQAPFGTGLRNLFLVHEAMHGIFYENQGFYDFVWDFWNNEMTEQQREFWKFFMEAINYSPDDTYLVVNEIQAYLLQYPHSNNNWYFSVRMPQRILETFPDKRHVIDSFNAQNPGFFIDASLRMNRELFRTTGMIGGDVRCLVP
ncbi:hypothetical protein [Spirochaeta dissipatitropha]